MKDSADTDPAAVLLARIRPATPSPDLMERLMAACPVLPAVVRRPKPLVFLPRLAAAAAVVAAGGIAVWFSIPPTAPSEIANVPGPVLTTEGAGIHVPGSQHIRQKLLGVRDLGFARDALSRPVRLMHATWLDHETGSEGSGASPARATRVRDEIVPVVLTTY